MQWTAVASDDSNPDPFMDIVQALHQSLLPLAPTTSPSAFVNLMAWTVTYSGEVEECRFFSSAPCFSRCNHIFSPQKKPRLPTSSHCCSQSVPLPVLEPMQIDSFHLTCTEHQCRILQHFCLYCGTEGHLIIYPLSILEQQAMEEYIEEALKLNLIRPFTSPASLSFIFVSKKNRGLWLCNDYCTLNS